MAPRGRHVGSSLQIGAHCRMATVVRAWFDRQALAGAMHLVNDERLLLAQTVGRPRA